MKKRIVAVVTVLALVSMSAFAVAAPKGGRGPAAEPALSAEKQAAVSKIVDKHHAKLVELREKIWAKHTELNALAQSGKADKADIQNLVAEISKLRTSMNQERDAMRAEIEKETGIKSYGRGFHRGGSGCGGAGAADGCGAGFGGGKGFGPGACPGGNCGY